MRLKEIFLTEVAKDEIAFQNIAKEIVRFVEINIDTFFEEGFLAKPITFFTGSKVLSHLYPRLRNLDLVLWSERGHKVKGSFSRPLSQIEIYLNLSSRNFDRNDVESTIVHELRHALDASLSKQAFDSHMMKGTYLKRPTEINARLSQVLRELTSFYKSRQPTLKDFIEEFEKLSLKYNLLSVFDDDEGIKLAEDALENGLFGRSITPEQASAILRNTDLTGLFKNRKYRRLVNRVTLFWNYLSEKK